MDPDSRIRILLRIRPKIEKIPTLKKSSIKNIQGAWDVVAVFLNFKKRYLLYNSCRVMKIGEHVNQGLKERYKKKLGLGQWANDFPLAEPYF